MKVSALKNHLKNIVERLYGVSLYTKTLGLIVFTTLLVSITTMLTVKEAFYNYSSQQ